MTFEKDAFCSYCGAKYRSERWPRECGACGNTVWRNPTPVAVAVVPCGGGILGVRRGIMPKKGELALPGGFIDFGESWQRGVCRELFEELGVVAEPDEVSLLAAHSVPNGRQIILFGLTTPVDPASLPPFAPNEEVTERVVLTGGETLAFPLHEDVMRQYFAGRR
ncbi:MAG TPA: NUDIX domain-containing protein [Patescibacteria group bacterium]|nr:NUDIX domain-containing protein [Patescibacteria group bacterium]